MQLYTIKEVSKILKMNITDTYKLIKSGNLQALKLGSLKVSSYELERFIREASGKDFSNLDDVKELIVWKNSEGVNIMREIFFVFAKFKDEDRIVLQGTRGSYKEAKKEAERLINLGHIADVFQLDSYLR